MDAPKVAPADWIRGWIGMLDAPRPAFGSTDLDILGEFSLGGPDQAADVCRRELGANDEFRRVMSDFEFQFRLCHGSSRASSLLRESRAGALGRVIEVLLRPVTKRLNGVGHAMDMRDRRGARRFAPISAAAAGPGVPPLVEAMGREAAERVAGRARRELSTPALAAV